MLFEPKPNHVTYGKFAGTMRFEPARALRSEFNGTPAFQKGKLEMQRINQYMQRKYFDSTRLTVNCVNIIRSAHLDM